MNALKLQATKGDIVAFDCRGGEPQDTHRTIFEQDPADERLVEILNMTLEDAAAELGGGAIIGDIVNRAIESLNPSGLVAGAIGELLDKVAPGEFRVQLRLMDGDGKA